jgi:hypothetical protein
LILACLKCTRLVIVWYSRRLLCFCRSASCGGPGFLRDPVFLRGAWSSWIRPVFLRGAIPVVFPVAWSTSQWPNLNPVMDSTGYRQEAVWNLLSSLGTEASHGLQSSLPGSLSIHSFLIILMYLDLDFTVAYHYPYL